MDERGLLIFLVSLVFYLEPYVWLPYRTMIQKDNHPENKQIMLRIAVQAKGRLYDETMSFLEESDIKLNATKCLTLKKVDS